MTNATLAATSQTRTVLSDEPGVSTRPPAGPAPRLGLRSRCPRRFGIDVERIAAREKGPGAVRPRVPQFALSRSFLAYGVSVVRLNRLTPFGSSSYVIVIVSWLEL